MCDLMLNGRGPVALERSISQYLNIREHETPHTTQAALRCRSIIGPPGFTDCSSRDEAEEAPKEIFDVLQGTWELEVCCLLISVGRNYVKDVCH